MPESELPSRDADRPAQELGRYLLLEMRQLQSASVRLVGVFQKHRWDHSRLREGLSMTRRIVLDDSEIHCVQRAKHLASMTRAEHLAWAKQRAIEYANAGDLQNAFNSMASDLNKHPELIASARVCNQLGIMLLMSGNLNTKVEMVKWIEGFD